MSRSTEDMSEKQPSSGNSLTDSIYQINSQPVGSSFDQQQINADTEKSTQLSTEENKLSSVLSTVESTQPVITSEEQQQYPLSSTSSTTTTTTDINERTTSTDHQSSIELPLTKENDEPLSSDSLVNTVRQIHAIPLSTRLSSTDNTTETTHIVKQEIEKPSVNSHVDIVQTNESIPNEPVTAKEEPVVQTTDIKDALPESNKISFVTETKQERTEEDETERLSSQALEEAVREILSTPSTSQLPSEHVSTETIVSVEKQDKKPSTDTFDQTVVEETSRTQKENVPEDIT
jgi:hypothetical protein